MTNANKNRKRKTAEEKQAKIEAKKVRKLERLQRKRAKVIESRNKNRDFISRKTSFEDICGIEQKYFKKRGGGKIAKCIATWIICCWRLKLIRKIPKTKQYDTEKLKKMEEHLLRWCEKNKIPNKGKAYFC